MPIPAGTLNTVRNAGMQTVRPIFNYWPVEEVAGGTIQSTPTLYPIGRVSVNWTTGNPSNVRVGQLYIIRSGTSIVSYGVVRLDVVGSSLFIDGKSRGDSGMAVEQAFAITTGQTVTVYTIQPLWSLLSRIQNGQFLKRFDVPYDGSGSNPSPVCNLGSWRQATVSAAGGRATFTFNNDNSFAWLNKTISTYQWTLPGSAVITGGGLTQDSITFTLPEGFHKVYCEITDSGGATQSSVRPIWVNGPNFLPMNERWAVEIPSDSQDRKGRNVSLNVIGELDMDDFLPGFPIHHTEEALYGGQTLSSGINLNNYAGYTAEELRVYDLAFGQKRVALQVYGPWAWMEAIPMVSQAIVEVQTPADWTDIALTLGIPDFINWYLLKHHSTFLDIFDYSPLPEADPPRKLNWGLNGNTMAEYLNQTANMFGGNIGCSSDGEMKLRRDPSLEETAFRSALDERMTITVDHTTGVSDITDPVEINSRFFSETGQLRVFSLAYNGNETGAFGAIAPGYTQTQAPGSTDEDSFLLKQTEGQDKTNRLAGHLLAKTNNPIKSIGFTLNRNMDFFDPPAMTWVRLSIPEDWSPRDEAINKRTVPLTVERTWEEAEYGAFVKTVTMSVEPETFGQPGETYDLDTGGGDQYEPVLPPIADTDPDDILDEVSPFLIATSEDGRLGRTWNGDQWTPIDNQLDGKVNDYAFNYFSTYIQGGYSEGTLDAWAISADETTEGSGTFDVAKIWYTENILDSNVTWTLQYTSPQRSSDIHGALRIVASNEETDYVVATVHDDNGNYMLRSTDGSTWSLVNAGAIVVDNSAGAIGEPVDLTLDGERAIMSGYRTPGNKYELGYFNDKTTTTFTFAASSPQGDIPWPMVTTNPDTSFIFATKVDRTTSSTTSTITWNVNTSGVPTLGLTGDWSTDDFSVNIDGDSPVTPVSNLDPSGVADICQGTLPGGSDDGWQIHTSVNTDPGVLPDKVFTATVFGEGENTNSDTGVWVQVTLVVYGEMTVEHSSLSWEWMVTATDYPSYTTCGLVSLLEPIAKMDMYDKEGQLVQQIFDGTGWNDPDGGSLAYNSPGITIFDPGNYSPTTGVNLINYTFYHIGDGASNYPPILFREITLETSSFTSEQPTTYRISNITSGTPTYTDISPTDRWPSNPYSLSIDGVDPTILTAVVREPGTFVTSRVGETLNSGTSWDIADTDLFIYGIAQTQEYGIAWGYRKILITNDGFATTKNAFGNWGDGGIDDGDLFRVVKGVLG